MATKRLLHDLRKKLRNSTQRSAWSDAYQRYVPKADIDNFTSRDFLQGIIQADPTIEATEKEEFLDHVYKNARIHFAMFVYYGLPIRLLRMRRFTDDRLPIPTNEGLESVEGDFEEVELDEYSFQFGELASIGQWMFLAPQFSSTAGHRKLDPNAILPFRSMTPVGSGTFGTVYNVQIEPSHLNYDIKNPLALKVITRRKETDGMSERRLLKGLRHFGHHHIIELLTSFEWERELGMFFPLATYDLDRYMSQDPPPVDSQYVSWLLTQFLGLTDALSKIHEYDQGSATSEILNRGYHHDLKPQNILFFQNSTRPMYGVFKISDFGVAKFRANERNATATRTTMARLGTPMYAPPELELEGTPSNLYDMWSFGCIILELLAWIEFKSKGKDSIMKGKDKFFAKSRNGNFDVHDWVEELIARLRRSDLDAALKEVLEIIVNGLLVWDPQGRWTSTVLLERLTMIAEKPFNRVKLIDSTRYPETLDEFH